MIESNVLQKFNGKKCYVTGGTGLIGREVVNLLLSAGAEVIVVSLDNIEFDNKAKYIKADLQDPGQVYATMVEVDYVFHLAGIKGSTEVTKNRPSTFFVPYLKFNTNVIEQARRNNVLGLVYTSSIGAYSPADVFVEGVGDDGEPMDTFPGWAKRMAELQIKSYQLEYGMRNFSIVRPCNVYGPGDNFDPDNAMVIPSLMYKIKQHLESTDKTPIQIWGDGSAIRDFAFSRDVAEGILQAMYYGTIDESRGTNYVNLASGTETSILQLVETLHDVIGDFEYKFDTTKPSGYPMRVMSIELANEKIHYYPTTSLYDGLKKTWEWFQQNEKEYLQKKNYFKE